MQKKANISLSLLLIFFLNFYIFQNLTLISEISLNIEENGKIEHVTSEQKSQFIYVKGTIDETKKYLLISIICEDQIKPSISITKNENFEIYKNEYDYILLPRENKLVLPYSYFDSDNINGFYMNIDWEGETSDISLKFEYVDEIILSIGEEFSFLAKKENIDNFKIIINKDEELKLRSTIGDIGFIISGGDEKQLSMTVNENKANKIFNNVFVYWMENNLEENILININITKNVKFYFKTQIFNSNDDIIDNKNIYENLYNQFYFVKNNREECFEFESSENNNEKDLIILSKEKFILNLYKSDSEPIKYEFNSNYNQFYTISDNLKINDTTNKICIKLNKENSNEISLIQVYFYDKLNKDGIIFPPLINGIKYSYVLSKKDTLSESNKNINIHTHSQFWERNSDQSDIIGTNAFIKSISGKMKVFTDLCSTYPKCGYNINSRFRREIDSINGNYHTSIKANSDSYSTCNRQNLFIIVCEDEEQECKYEILFSDNQKETLIRSGEMLSKYLEPYSNVLNYKNQDLYFTYLHGLKNKIVINLVVYSGDAYIVQINDIKGCRFKEEHMGSDEKRIFYCDENEMDDYYALDDKKEIKIIFGIRGGKNGGVYSLYVYEQQMSNEEIYLPVEMSKFDIIHDNIYKFKLLYNTYNYKENKKEENELITLINPINCDINLNDETNNNILNLNEDNFIQYPNIIKNNSFSNIYLEKIITSNLINKCLFQINSYISSNEDSFLIITENKPLKLKLNNDMDNARVAYLYGMTNGIKKIYLKVNVLGNSAIKIRIENINENNLNEYFVRDSKIITIMNGNNRNVNGMSLNNVSKLKIYIQLLKSDANINENKEAKIELKIITDSNSPNFLKKGEQINDVLINNEYKYYIALVSKGSYGNYYLNVNNAKIGNIYGRLVDSDYLKENGGWNNRFVLPTKNTDKNKLLPYDFENQKLIIEKEHTNYCNNYCYLLIGVNIFEENIDIDITKNYIYGFNSYLRLYNTNDDSIDEKNKFIKLIDNEYISNYVIDEESDYFAYELTGNNPRLKINFECDNCILNIAFNDTDFNSPNAIKVISNEEKREINLGKDFSISNSISYIKINSINNEEKSANNKKNNIKYRYSLKLKSDDDDDHDNSINYIDSSMPETCKFSKDKQYYDYIIKLDAYNNEKDINIIAVANNEENTDNDINNTNIKKKIKIYANILNDNENITINNWPDENNHQFPEENQKYSNYLNINKNKINKGENNKDDIIMLVRVYGEKNNKIDLYTNYEDSNIENDKKELVIPGKYQLITVNNSLSDSSYKINIPSSYLDKNKDYIYKIKKLDGNGKIKYGNEIYELNDKYDSLSFPLDRGLSPDLNSIDIKSTNSNKNNTYNESLTFLIKYEEKNKFNSLEKVKIGSSKYFTSKDDTESIDHFIPLENINNDLPINIDFESLISSEEDEYKDQIRNSTESFDINGFLITEDELNDIKNGNISVIENKKDYKYKGNYYLANKHGFLNINKKDIDNFKNNQKQNGYLYFTVRKSKINDKKYDSIKGKINVYPQNIPKISFPENDYHINSIDCSKNDSHIYKLGDISKDGDISDDSHNLKIDFISPVEGLKLKILKDANQTEEDQSYFEITRKENDNGKDTITISKNIGDAYLLVSTPDKLLNSSDSANINPNIDYMFKYTYENKDKDISDGFPEVQYDNSISYNKMKPSDLKTNITLSKIKNPKTNKSISCDYYIRVYKNPKKTNSKNEKVYYYPKKNISLINNNDGDNIYAVYKISSNNTLLQDDKNNFIIPIEIDTNEPVLVDAIAESTLDKKIYGYNKAYPNSEGDTDGMIDDGGSKKDDNKGGDNKNNNSYNNWFKFGLIILGGLLLFILLIICCVKFCCCKKRNNLDDRPTSGLNDITIHTTDNDDDSYFTTRSIN